MGSPLPTTVILNRKALDQDEGDEVKDEEKASTEPDLFGREERSA
jgi:hypothetical protein